jgi:hypothetical protein
MGLGEFRPDRQHYVDATEIPEPKIHQQNIRFDFTADATSCMSD